MPPAGFAFGDGGMARPNLGVLVPPFARLPGIGGRSNGAGEDMLGWLFDVELPKGVTSQRCPVLDLVGSEDNWTV